MRVRVIKQLSIEDYAAVHADSKASFERWLTTVKYADWEAPQNIVDTFNTADILGNGSERVVFKVKGNDYRMICKYAFGISMVRLFVCWIGTHAEYDKLCDKDKQYDVHEY